MYILPKSHGVRFWTTVTILAVSIIVWLFGLSQSPLFKEDTDKERISDEQRQSKEFESDQLMEKVLAEAYWRRYPDVENSHYYGRQGPMGLFGAIEHFRQHGEREGRILAPILSPDDFNLEKQLAEAYWLRYPEIERNDIWGRGGSLGILGPRDHYHYLGRHAGYKWGVNPE